MSNKKLPNYKYQLPLPEGEIPIEILTFDQLNSFGKQNHPHSHTFFQILYITGGSGRHIIDFNSYTINPPIIFFIIPGRVHYYLLDTPLKGYAILFLEDFLLSNINGYPHTYQPNFLIDNDYVPFLQINPDEAIIVNKLIADIYAEYIDRDLHHYSTLQAYLHILFVNLQRMFVSSGQKYEMSVSHLQILQFKKLVSQYFLTERSIQFYADELSLNATYLATLVKDLTGETPGQIIRRAVILEAKRLLIYHELTVEQVGTRLKFKDPSYFGRYFKREVGVSPRVFREYTLEKHQKS